MSVAGAADDNAAGAADDNAAPPVDAAARPAPTAVRFRVTGRVQGVYFRAATRQAAEGLGLRGWVRNRGDGAVEGHLQGDEATLAAMLDWCRGGPPGAAVERLTWEPAPVDTNLTGFSIRP
jgi:acylphosphatase